MAICGRCGQTQSAGDDCPYCSEYVSAISPVGAYSGSASSASYGAAATHGFRPLDHYLPADDDDGFRYEQAEPEFAALPPCERPFAAERTVWSAALELGPAPADYGRPGDDLAVGEHAEHDPERIDEEQVAAEQQRPTAFPGREDIAADAADRLQLAELNGHGRWFALTAAILVVVIAAAGALTLVLRHGRASQIAGRDRPSVTARPSVAKPVSVPPAGQNQLVVDPSAATAPNEAAVVSFLGRYFGAVNNDDFGVYKRLFIRPLRPGLSPASVTAALGTTTRSGQQLDSISVLGDAEVNASVTFTTRQPTPGSEKSTCTAWSIDLRLGWRGSRYLLVAAPLWYQATANSCS